MPLMIDVSILPHQVETVQFTGCADCIVESAKGSVAGHEKGGAYCVSFTDQRTEAAFRARWLKGA